MKVLQMVDVPWDSGLAHYALLLGKGLQDRGHQVYVSAIPGEKPWKKADRFGLRTMPFVTFSGLKALREFLRLEGIEVINAHTGSTHSLAVAASLGQKVAVVRTRSDARTVKRKIGSSFLFGHTPRVIAAAEYIRQAYIRAVKLEPDRVVTVYQGVDVAAYDPETRPTHPTVGIVARLDPVKGHRYLLEALSILKPSYPTLKVLIVGQDENIKQRELRNVAERLRIDHMIEFAGFQNDIPSIMARCTLGVVASTGSEAVSRVALEWMAAGRPVVATRVGCLPELVHEQVTGYLIPPQDAPALAQTVARLLHDPAKAWALGAAGRQRAEKRFGLDRFVDDTLQAYQAAHSEALKK
jgi:glycosyltransferase involved in cell wall biosynthesis